MDQKTQEQNSIPVGKIQRASQFVKTGLKVGGNYLKYYAQKAVDKDLPRESLHDANAEDIYDSLSKLKGSALKVAQMMSMDCNLLPKAYSDRFQMSQYSAPPLSGPLVVKTFQKNFGKGPDQLFDRFNLKASNAASIGQVHEAWLGTEKLAVKVQYPGVSDSIKSDLKMVKPFAVRLVGLNEADVDRYMEEVETKLLDETDYRLELQNGVFISEACKDIANLYFPKYYPELSSDRVLTMGWITGMHMREFLATNPSQEVRNRIGQALWDFYEHQIHTLKMVHADPHPGNFYFTPEGQVGIIDFGCVKELEPTFYNNYFALINPNSVKDAAKVDRLFKTLEFLYESDTPTDVTFFTKIFVEMIELLGRPFHGDSFDFGDDEYFAGIYAYGEALAKMKQIRESKVARGSRHGLYINRTYYGLYSMLNELKAVVNTHSVFKSLVLD